LDTSSKWLQKYDQTRPRAAGLTFASRSPPPPLTMSKLPEFYRRYRQYILSDGLMYVVFILALALMFVFFG
jgi:hypothetical protein